MERGIVPALHFDFWDFIPNPEKLKTARPIGRAVLSFTGFGMKSQQGVFREWLATRPTCEVLLLYYYP